MAGWRVIAQVGLVLLYRIQDALLDMAWGLVSFWLVSALPASGHLSRPGVPEEARLELGAWSLELGSTAAFGQVHTEHKVQCGGAA